ncbi:MAG: Arabinose metabolism transcriptional repressor [Firmicutes bacterium ADurb.Bin182]|nr:MAG: Arabinose metabolism transcriptional repressor [Firmicutes bacterium ADurb.Bin182]
MKQTPKYMHLADSLRKIIDENHYPDGFALETEYELAKRYSLSRQTVRHALDILASEGKIKKIKGSGTYVKRNAVLNKKTKIIGVIVTYISQYIFPSILRGIESELTANGYSMELSSTSNQADKERDLLNEYINRPVDGLIIEGTKTNFPNPNIRLYRELFDIGVPYVFINGYYPELKSISHVITDDCGASKKAVEYLAQKGHTRIAGIFKSDDMQGIERYRGYFEGFDSSGLEFHDNSVFWFNTENRNYLFREDYLMKLLNGYTAVICYNDEIAIQVYELIRKAGKSVPGDIAVISFDNSIFSDLNTVKITSMNHPKEEIGIIAARQLIKMINGGKCEYIVLPMELIEKEST